MNKFLLSLLIYGQIVLGGTAIEQEPQYQTYRRPRHIAEWAINTRYFEYLGSVKVEGELKPLFTLRQEEG